jgi:GNAT superfamily N-acetyltransferase
MLSRLISWIARRLSRYAGVYLSRVVVRPLAAFEATRAIGGIRCRLAKERELLCWCDDPALELTEEQIHAACARGDLCVGAYDGERLVGYEWLGFGPTPHVGRLWVQFSPGDCYMYKKFVLPAYRGNGIAALLDAKADEIAALSERERIVCFIDVQNAASWRSAKRRLCWVAGYIGYIALFGLSIPFRTGGAMREGFRFFGE